jgi:hypothetical protein
MHHPAMSFQNGSCEMSRLRTCVCPNAAQAKKTNGQKAFKKQQGGWAALLR